MHSKTCSLSPDSLCNALPVAHRTRMRPVPSASSADQSCLDQDILNSSAPHQLGASATKQQPPNSGFLDSSSGAKWSIGLAKILPTSPENYMTWRVNLPALSCLEFIEARRSQELGSKAIHHCDNGEKLAGLRCRKLPRLYHQPCLQLEGTANDLSDIAPV